MLKKYAADIENQIKTVYASLSEKDRRKYIAIEALKLGYGGKKYLCNLVGCSLNTLKRGILEIEHGSNVPLGRIRMPGGGRKKKLVSFELKSDIDMKFLDVLKDNTAGSPMDEDIKWTNLTLNQIRNAMGEKGCRISRYHVKQLLKKHGFVRRTMQKNRTMKEVKDRNAQFENIQMLKAKYINSGNPVISIDVKKKEQIGNFYRAGSFYGTCELEVYDHDFNSFSEGVIIPHGIYDLVRNEGYITIGTSKDTSEFSCDNIEQWWINFGKFLYPDATEILILADGGGSNSSSHYIFKEDLQKLVDKIGVSIRIAHYPPYTSKYNPIEHRLFCHVTRACKGVVFTSVELVRDLIDKTSTSTGLNVISAINRKIYQTGRKVVDGFKQNMKIVFDNYLGKWNYTAVPQS